MLDLKQVTFLLDFDEKFEILFKDSERVKILYIIELIRESDELVVCPRFTRKIQSFEPFLKIVSVQPQIFEVRIEKNGNVVQMLEVNAFQDQI